MARKAVNTAEIPEAKIRQVKWMLKTGKTKKACCELLGIAYNTKRLEKIVEDFDNREAREAQLKKAARNKIFTESEKETIARAYLAGETQSALAKQFYISPQRIKKILIETGTPIRARGKKQAATVDHIVQDLEIKFKEGDKVFIAKENCFAFVDKVYDEDFLEYLETGRQKAVDLVEFKPNRLGSSGGHYEPKEGIHYEVYWIFDDGSSMKMRAMLHLRNQVINNLEETGREFYRVWCDADYKMYKYVKRHELYPVKA
jgi:transposase-like protein